MSCALQKLKPSQSLMQEYYCLSNTNSNVELQRGDRCGPSHDNGTIHRQFSSNIMHPNQYHAFRRTNTFLQQSAVQNNSDETEIEATTGSLCMQQALATDYQSSALFELFDRFNGCSDSPVSRDMAEAERFWGNTLGEILRDFGRLIGSGVTNCDLESKCIC